MLETDVFLLVGGLLATFLPHVLIQSKAVMYGGSKRGESRSIQVGCLRVIGIILTIVALFLLLRRRGD
jgi:hypothetical protein